MKKSVKFWAVYLIIGGSALMLLALALTFQYNAFDRAVEPVSRGGDVGASSGDLIVYVDGSRPNDDGDGLSWPQAKKTVDSAFGVMKNGTAINRFIKIAEHLDQQNNPIPYITVQQLDLIETTGINYDFNLTVEGGYRKNGGIFEEVPTGDKGNTIISGADNHRIFAFKQSSYSETINVSFRRLTLTRGLANTSICEGCGIQGGGAIYAENLSINISNVLVSNSLHSTVSRGGGALDFFNTNNEIKNCAFVNNSSNRGSAAVLYISSSGLLRANKTTIQDSSFTNNFSTGKQDHAHIVYVQGGSFNEAKIKGNYFFSNAKLENQGNAIIRAIDFNISNRTVELSGNHFIENGGPTLSSIISFEDVGTNLTNLTDIKKYSVGGNYFRNNISSGIFSTAATGSSILYNSFSNNIISNNTMNGQSIISSLSNVTPLIINNTLSNNRFIARIPNSSIFQIRTSIDSLTQGNRLIAINNVINEVAVGEKQSDLPNYYFHRLVYNADGIEIEPPNNVDRIFTRFCKNNLFPISGSFDPGQYITKDIRANYDFKTKCLFDGDDKNLKQLAGEIQFLDLNENSQSPTALAFDPDAIYKINGQWEESININIDRGVGTITISGSPQNVNILFNEDFLNNPRFIDISNHGGANLIDLGAIEYQDNNQRAKMPSLPANFSGQAPLKLKVAIEDSQGQFVYNSNIAQGRKGHYLLPAEWQWRSLFQKGMSKGYRIYLRPYGTLTQRIDVNTDTGLPLNYHSGITTVHLSGDVDKDGVIGLGDLNILLNNFAKIVGEFPDPDDKGDLNGDYQVNLNDLNILLSNFAKTGVPWPL